MNFDDAIKAHASWKMKLQSYIRHPDKSLKYEVVCKDNQCDLGKWIYAEGKAKCGHHADFEELRKTHAEFHIAAADVIKRADSGENITDEIAVGSKSKFSASSTKITSLLMKFRKLCDESKAA